MIRPHVRTVIVSAIGAALLSATAACSSGPAAAEQPAGDRDAFMQCLTEHGVPAPPGGGSAGPPPGGPPPGGPNSPPPDGASPPPGHGWPADGSAPPAPPGVDQQVWNEASQACASLAPEHPPRS